MALNYLLILDTDKIKNYIFASSTLKEIRGASMLLEYLNTKNTRDIIANHFGVDSTELENISEIEIVYLDGGSGKVEFLNQGDAEACGQKIEEAYREWTETATITWVVIPINQKSYYESVAEGEYKLRYKKQKGHAYGQGKHLGFVHRCSHNGIEMVGDIKQEFFKVNGVEYSVPLNQDETFSKVSPSSVIKQTFYKNNKKTGSEIKNIFENLYKDEQWGWPKQLTVIGEAAENGDIGFLYFDGNSMNKVLKSLHTSEAYKRFSENLRVAIQNSLTNTVKSFYPDVNSFPCLHNKDEEDDNHVKSKVLPIEFILTAGDDVIVIVPSTLAMEFATTFQENFVKETKIIPEVENELTMAAGVVISKAKFPIKYIVPLAEQLLKSAKNKNYELKRDKVEEWNALSTLDYMVVSMSANPDLNNVRNEQLKRKDGNSDKNFVLTNRPYTHEQWLFMKDTIQKMKSGKTPISNTKLKSFYQVHFMEKWEGDYYFQKYFANLDSLQKDNLRNLYENLSDTMFHSPWYEQENGDKVTPLIDLIEIYRYVDKEDKYCKQSILN